MMKYLIMKENFDGRNAQRSLVTIAPIKE
jgi:hypothetical protein